MTTLEVWVIVSRQGRGKFMKFPLPLGERVRVRGM